MTRKEVLEILDNSGFLKIYADYGITYRHISSVEGTVSAEFYISDKHNSVCLIVFDTTKHRPIANNVIAFQDIKEFTIDSNFVDSKVIRISLNYPNEYYIEK